MRGSDIHRGQERSAGIKCRLVNGRSMRARIRSLNCHGQFHNPFLLNHTANPADPAGRMPISTLSSLSWRLHHKVKRLSRRTFTLAGRALRCAPPEAAKARAIQISPGARARRPDCARYGSHAWKPLTSDRQSMAVLMVAARHSRRSATRLSGHPEGRAPMPASPCNSASFPLSGIELEANGLAQILTQPSPTFLFQPMG